MLTACIATNASVAMIFTDAVRSSPGRSMKASSPEKSIRHPAGTG